jgi:hypothetical protein
MAFLQRIYGAPCFFTVTGLVITYLLFRTDDPEKQNKRVSKTVKRAWKLILWGYVLNTNIFYVLSGHFSKGFFSVNVLHCIGLGLLVLMGTIFSPSAEKIKSSIKTSCWCWVWDSLYLSRLSELMNSRWTIHFYWGISPRPTAVSLRPCHGWDILFFGGFLGMIYVRFYHNRKASYVMMAGLVLAGTLMVLFSSRFFMNLSILFQVELFKDIAYNNYLFIRLGYVFIIIAVFFGLENLLSKLPSLNKIGQNTLNIYIVHYIILYGSIFGLGLSHFYYRALAPAQVITGAAIFMIISVFLAGKAQHVSVRDILKNLRVDISVLMVKLSKKVKSGKISKIKTKK